MAEQNVFPHRLSLNERKELTVTGVTEVVSFDEESVVLKTSLGTLTVHGRQLQLKNLSANGGQVEVLGSVDALIYQPTKPAGGWIRTVPADAAQRVLWGLAVGAILGLLYDFLRPLRRRRNAPADLCFVVALLAGWVWYSFQICGGDIRFGGTASLGIGILLWLGTAGFPARRFFSWFWMVIFRILSVFWLPFAKFFKKIRLFLKKVFAYGKKRGYNRNSNPPQILGGTQYE